MSDRFFNTHVIFTRPTQLTLAPGAECLSPNEPPADGKPTFIPPGDIGFGYPLTAWMGDRPVASSLFTPRQARALGYSLLFRDPMRLALEARLIAGRHRGLILICVGAVPVTFAQRGELQELEDQLPEGVGLRLFPDGEQVLDLGHYWFPFPIELLETIPFLPGDSEDPEACCPETRARLDALTKALSPIFDRIVLGDPSEEAERLLSSIPGIAPTPAASHPGRNASTESLPRICSEMGFPPPPVDYGEVRVGRMLGPEIDLGLTVVPGDCEHSIDFFGRLRVKGEVLRPLDPGPFDQNLELVLRLGNEDGAVFSEATQVIIGEAFEERLPFDLELDPMGYQPTVLWITFRKKELRRCKQCGSFREKLGPRNGLCFGCSYGNYKRRTSPGGG